MESIGLITFHAAYNFGSVLQAYATWRTIRSLAPQSTRQVVNYRMKEQRRYYNRLVRTQSGLKNMLKDIYQLPVAPKRIERMRRYERFITEELDLTDEVTEPEQALRLMGRFGTMVSGSDQIWSRHALEMVRNPVCYMDPYLLKGFDGRKVSYATSTGNMTLEELAEHADALKAYDMISMRERRGAELISEVIGRDVQQVLDPTFLLSRDEWARALDLPAVEDEGSYVFFYSLEGVKPLLRIIPVLERVARARGLSRVVVATPFARAPKGKGLVEQHPEFGPRDILQAIRGASLVVTDSYHGAMLSLNMGRDVFSLCRGWRIDYRMREVFDRWGLGDRVIASEAELDGRETEAMDYGHATPLLEKERAASRAYLCEALEA